MLEFREALEKEWEPIHLINHLKIMKRLTIKDQAKVGMGAIRDGGYGRVTLVFDYDCYEHGREETLNLVFEREDAIKLVHGIQDILDGKEGE